MKKKEVKKNQLKIKKILVLIVFITIFTFLFKVIPMKLFGEDILFDASLHIMATSFILFLFWDLVFEKWKHRVIYIGFSFIVLAIVGIHRIVYLKHNLFGLTLGLGLSIISIYLIETRIKS